jgi:hypothetical protein
MKKRATKKQKIKTRFVKKESPNKKNNKLKFWLITGAIILLAILALFLINKYTGKAIDPLNTEDPLGIGLNPENMPQTPEDAGEIANNYLKKEWGKEFRNPQGSVGKYTYIIFEGYDKISPYTDPIFKAVLGVEPSLTWLFILTLTLWITFAIFFYRILSVFSTFSKGVSIIASLCLIVIMSTLKITLTIANWIINTISLLTSWWMQLIVAIAVIIGLVVLSTFSKEWTILVKAWKESKEKSQQKEDIAEAKQEAETANQTTKTITEAFDEGAGI